MVSGGPLTSKRGRPSRKNQIVKAAEALLRERGLNGMTTRAVAEAVPCSEGAIYFHFEDRLALILEVLHESLPEMLVPLHALTAKAGTGDPEQNLLVAVTGLARFHRRVTLMLCSLMSEPELLARFRQSLGDSRKGPHRGIATLAKYIEQEQTLGRISSGVNANAAATALMAGTFFRQFTAELFGQAQGLQPKHLVQFSLRTPDSTQAGVKRVNRR
jgi:AcrR family transcriptional regulator